MDFSHPNPDPKNQRAFDILRMAVLRYKSAKPFVVGITGAGGAGKTTFGNNIALAYGIEHCASIDLDDYLVSREQRGKMGITGYNPRANNLFRARDDIEQLVRGKPTMKPCYDHTTGKLLADELIEPRDLLVIEGVTTLYPELRDLCDVSFFLDALEETQIQSRIERDVKRRGYTYAEALTLFEATKPDYAKYIEPTKAFASAIFQVGTDYVMHPLLVQDKFK